MPSSTSTRAVARRSKPVGESPKPGRRRHLGRRAAPRPPVVLQVRDLSVRAPGGAQILDEVSFAVPRGSLVAVVGPTGAGKTTLLNALTGRISVDSGSILINGADVLGADSAGRRSLGYVPQDDPIHLSIALRKLLEYTAALRLGNMMGPADRAQRVSEVLDELGLTAQADLPVGFLSGGQRKRASVAIELISRPEVLVLDEPTTGLDPGREKAVLTMLRKVADCGRTVITVTHSAAALTVCDAVLFLAPGGKVAFFGPPSEALAYFGQADTADVFIALGDADREDWKARFRAHPSYNQHVVDVSDAAEADSGAAASVVASTPWNAAGMAQLRTLGRRYVDVIRGDRRFLKLLALQGPLLGALLWAVLPAGRLHHVASTAPVAMFLVLSATWLGAANAAREIVKEHRILLREEGTGLSLLSYVTSKITILGSLSVLQAIVLTVIACSRQGVPAHGAVIGSGLAEITLAVAVSALAAVALGLLISAAVTTADKAMTLLPMTLVAQLVLCGAWVKVDTPGLHQLGNLTGAHWGIQAITATVRHDSRAWLSAMVALTGITVGAAVATMALVERRVRPVRLQGTARPSIAVVARRALVPVAVVAGVGLLAGVAGAVRGATGTHTSHVAVAQGPVATTVAPSAPAVAAAPAVPQPAPPVPATVPAKSVTATPPTTTPRPKPVAVSTPVVAVTVPAVAVPPVTTPVTTPTPPPVTTPTTRPASTQSVPWWWQYAMANSK